jgi:hypothetical protein
MSVGGHWVFQAESVSMDLMGEHLVVYSTIHVFLRVTFPFRRFLGISFSVDRDLVIV